MIDVFKALIIFGFLLSFGLFPEVSMASVTDLTCEGRTNHFGTILGITVDGPNSAGQTALTVHSFFGGVTQEELGMLKGRIDGTGVYDMASGATLVLPDGYALDSHPAVVVEIQIGSSLQSVICALK